MGMGVYSAFSQLSKAPDSPDRRLGEERIYGKKKESIHSSDRIGNEFIVESRVFANPFFVYTKRRASKGSSHDKNEPKRENSLQYYICSRMMLRL